MDTATCSCEFLVELRGNDADRYAREHLVEVSVDVENWTARYRCPDTGRTWLRDSPQGELHGGGPPRLRQVAVVGRPSPDLGSAPAALRALVSALTDSGFELAAEQGDGGVNRVLELAGPGCRVRVAADRGQWWVELARPPEGDWYDPDVWAACLDGRSIDRAPSSLDEQADFISRRWIDVATAAPDVAHCLSRQRATRAHKRLGLLPPAAPGVE